jgi:prevent-host-death family protein
MAIHSIGAGDFKAKCLKLLDEVAASKEPLTITKHGKPVARLVPIADEAPLFGALQGSVLYEGDIIAPLDNDWDATQ